MGPDKTPYFKHLDEAQEEFARLKTLEDELKQDLYEAKKAKNIEGILILELQDEIEYLKKELKKKQTEADFENGRRDVNKDIQNLKNEVTCLQTQLDEQVELEKNLVEDYLEKVAVLKVKCKETFNIADLNSDIQKAKIENDKLKLELVSNEEKMVLLIETKEDFKNLERQMEIMQSEINQKKSRYENNKCELGSILKSLQDLRNNNSDLLSELTSLKAGPIGNIHRGNSLFAEVEDYTSTLMHKRTLLEMKYNKLKKLMQQKNSSITDLKIKNANLQPKICSVRESVESIITKYMKEISTLELSIAELSSRPYKPDLIFEGREENLKWIQTFIDMESRKALLADKQFRAVSTELFNLSCTVLRLEAETEVLTEDISGLAAQLKELQIQLENKEKEVKSTKPAQTEKSNKTVHFAEGT